MRKILSKAPRCAAIDSSSAAEYLRKPDATGATYPFAGTGTRGRGEPLKGSGSQEKKRGKKPTHARAQAKYAGGRVAALAQYEEGAVGEAL